MSTPGIKLLRSTLACVAISLFAAVAGAQDFPNKPIHIVVPFAPGGGTDTLTRLVAMQMADQMKQQVIIDNRPGAGGALGAALVAKAPADGYTLYVASSATAMMPGLYKNLSFDPIADFAPVALIGTAPFVLIVNNKVPANTLPELLALAKARPGTLSYGSAGNGSVNHVNMELFKAMAGVDILHVPYKGSSAALADVIGGQLTMMMDTLVEATPQVKTNNVRALAVTSLTRSSLAPELPTVSELGPQGYESVVWYGLTAPKGTPEAVLQRLNQEVNKAMASPAIRQRYATLGAEPASSTLQSFDTLIHSEEKKWTAVEKQSNIHID